MLRKLAAMVCSLGVALAVLVANSSVWPASVLVWHQPEVPVDLRK
ncbi:AgrD family cyclic lactone autoinducer peptide [Moorella sulfitireducens (nom. illeg.)]|nr:cyclic lactone autoinducer peptide [Moorella sulfitireducens]